jgi:hypothetical protein
MIRATAALLLATLLCALSACGEKPQVVNYKQGTYQGKPDTPPYSNPPFNGDKAAWERALAARAQNQSEYNRIH